MADDKKNDQTAPPAVGPYVFPTILAALGLWCLYDGWFSSDPDMQEHLMFNRGASIVLLSWALIDFIRTRRSLKNEVSAEGGDKTESRDD